MLKWDQRYEVGHERIDAEHRIFLRLMVEFQEAAAKNAPKEKLIRILHVIIKYAEFHFSSEESMMTDYQYPDQTQHAYLHNLLLGELNDSFSQFQQDMFDSGDVSSFLINWFILHIAKQDKKLVSYIGKPAGN
jgi:hemerythrin